MSPDELRGCLAALDWSQRGLAAQLRLHPTTVRRWAMGDTVIPSNVAVWLNTLAAAHRREPHPRGWFQHTGSGVPLYDRPPIYSDTPTRPRAGT